MRGRERRKPTEPGPRGLRVVGQRRHRHEAANPGKAFQPSADRVGRHARLRGLAGEVDLQERRDREPPGGRLRVDRVDQLADRVDCTRLVRLEVPDEVPAEGVAVDGVLRDEILCAVFADHLHPGLDERPELGERNVLRRGHDGHVRAGLLAHAEVALADGRGAQRRHSPASASRCPRSFAAGSSITSSSRRASAAPIAGPSR